MKSETPTLILAFILGMLFICVGMPICLLVDYIFKSLGFAEPFQIAKGIHDLENQDKYDGDWTNN